MKFYGFLAVLVLFGTINIQASPVKSSSELDRVHGEFIAFVQREKIEEIFRNYASEYDRRYIRFMTQDLTNDLVDFLRLLPWNEITKINVDYWKNDEEFHKLSAYLKSQKFKDSLVRIESVTEVKSFLQFIQNSGIDIYGFLRIIHDILELPAPEKSSSWDRRTGGVAGYFTDMKALLPIESITRLNREKSESSPEFARFIERLTSQEHHDLVNAVRANEEARAVLVEFKSEGLDVEAIGSLGRNIVGIEW